MVPNCDRTDVKCSTILDSVREVVRSREFRKFVRPIGIHNFLFK